MSRGALTFILTRGIGQSFIARDVPASEVLSFLRESHPGQESRRMMNEPGWIVVAVLAVLVLLVIALAHALACPVRLRVAADRAAAFEP